MLSTLRHRAALLCAAVLLQGCATSGSLNDARNQFFSGQPQAALTTLETESVSNRDRLLALLDKGLIAHTAGAYAASTIAFKDAATLLDEIDFISVREQSASMISNDWVTTYKGEYSERLWIHTFQMMNFLLLDRPESAAVEARQALKIYDAHSGDLNKDWYSRTLIAMSFEAAGFADSAHIEYKKLLNEVGYDVGMARRAWQNAKRLGRKQDANKFKQLITSEASVGSSNGELVVFLQTGSIPHKIAGEIYVDSSTYASFPTYPVIPRPDVDVLVSKDGVEQQADIVSIQTVNISRNALAARGKRIATKQILRIAAKKELARALSKENEGLGGLLTAAFLISERADTRSWETLPAHVTLIQVPLSVGNHTIRLSIQEDARSYELLIPNVDIKKHSNTYRSFRVGAGAPRIISSTKVSKTMESDSDYREQFVAIGDGTSILDFTVATELPEASSTSETQKGVLVTKVEEAGAAAVAGILPGDVISSFDGSWVESGRQFNVLLADAKQGENLPLLVHRDKSAKFLVITMPE